MSEQISISSEVGMIWESADSILRDTYKRHQYQDVILPFVVLRRIESVLLQKRAEIREKHGATLNKLPPKEQAKIISEQVRTILGFDNTSEFTLEKLANEKESALKDNGQTYVFADDYTFDSPSSAAIAILGRRANGWMEWKDKDGKTLDEKYRKTK